MTASPARGPAAAPVAAPAAAPAAPAPAPAPAAPTAAERALHAPAAASLDGNAATRTHRRAVWTMVAVTLMWSIAGVVSRQIHATPGIEFAFWRSLFCALAVGLWFATQGGGSALRQALQQAGRTAWVTGAMWAVAFTCFAVALSLTRAANVLIVQSLGPSATALLAWAVFRRRPSLRSTLAIAAAACGIALMYVFDLAALDARHALGLLIALGIPLASAINWVSTQRAGQAVDLSVAVLLGAALSAAVALPLAWPLRAPPADLAWLALLGVVQLAIPCVLAMRAARHLQAAEVSLLCLLEVVFGILWTVLAGERPGPATWVGGALVLGALVVAESAGLRRTPKAAA